MFYFSKKQGVILLLFDCRVKTVPSFHLKLDKLQDTFLLPSISTTLVFFKAFLSHQKFIEKLKSQKCLKGSLILFHRYWWFHWLFRPSSSQTVSIPLRILGIPVHLHNTGTPVVNVTNYVYCRAVTRQTQEQKKLPCNCKTKRILREKIF